MIKYKDYNKDGLNTKWYLMDESAQWHTPKGKSISLFGSFFYIYWSRNYFWFRFFNGYGIHGKNTKKTFLLFSERNKLQKTTRIKSWTFRILKPYKP